AVSRPTHRLAAVELLVPSERPEHDLRTGRAASAPLTVGKHGDLVPTVRDRRERVLAGSDQPGRAHDRAEPLGVERGAVEGELAAHHDTVAGTLDRARLRRTGPRAELEGPVQPSQVLDQDVGALGLHAVLHPGDESLEAGLRLGAREPAVA